jgi:CubicO group peptidase (beta-lactamase class C family)
LYPWSFIMNDIRREIENSLLPAVRIIGKQANPLNLADRMVYYRVPAVSLALIENGQISYSAAFGRKSATNDDGITPETLFQAASISKPVAAAGAMTLVQEGLLDLDEDVNQRLRTWQVPENEFIRTTPATLRGLLSHSAGLSVHGFPGYAAGAPLPNIRQILDGEPPANTAPVRVTIEPGTQWMYSGGGYTVLQLLIEEVTGQPFSEVMRERVLEPMMMNHSAYSQPLSPELISRAAAGHMLDGKPLPGNWHTYPEKAAAGLWTTPSDLAVFACSLMAGLEGHRAGLLTPETVSRMLEPQVGGYGLGPRVDQKNGMASFGHGGSNEGYRCTFMALPGTRQGAAVMTNSDNGTDLYGEILRGLDHVFGWNWYEIPEKQTVALKPSQLLPHAGGYRTIGEMEELFNITCQDERLWVEFSGRGTRYELLPETDMDFFIAENGIELAFHASDGDDRSEVSVHLDKNQVLEAYQVVTDC